MTSHLLTGVRPYGEDPTDILITDGTITAIGPDAAAKAPADAVRHDLDGLIALPGLVDIHTHLREPGRESAETVFTGTRAAAVGGYTVVFAMANTSRRLSNSASVSFSPSTNPRSITVCRMVLPSFNAVLATLAAFS